MSTQFTPTFARMWHKDFFMLVVAELLLCTSYYMVTPFTPLTLGKWAAIAPQNAAFALTALIFGICLSGAISNWLIQRYRRNKVFVVSATAFGILTFGIPFICRKTAQADESISFLIPATAFALAGATFGLAKRVISCTLIIDKTESHHRTEANYASVAVARMALAIGPVLYIIIGKAMPHALYFATAAAFAVVPALLVLAVKFPFRAPEEYTSIVSADRFFLTRGWRDFIGITCATIPFGMVFTKNGNATFYIMTLAGFLLALIALRYKTFRETRHVPMVALAAYALAVMHILTSDMSATAQYLAPLITGGTLGTICSAQLFHLLSQCQHCQRSTAESTYFLASDTGIIVGITVGITLQTNGIHTTAACIAACLTTAVTLLPYRKTKNKHCNN